MHFSSYIHNKTFSVVLGYVELCLRQDEKRDNLKKKQFSEICSLVTSDTFIPCFVDLCKALWDILLNYQRVLYWHRENDSAEDVSPSDIQDLPSDGFEDSFNKRFVQQRLEHGLLRIWQDVQNIVRVFMSNHDLPFEDFVKALRVARRMIEIGTRFCRQQVGRSGRGAQQADR